ncbi:hemerythrin domain-containing protein [Roseospira visakhapatnamensis]|uniref:Hemerythrin-like metal-binding protein n=1 Tax=Roseospira visakhapatnamensis TaxID=390880 RepID=A0A7W6W936_9PROT|nr:hemerythrin domain-containing protein [Roseospira visakhapatnamensis]MBB4265443.1 hemerythrin-like metal-binding protein [Roseospira visakhapatnamensis]
MDDDIGIIQWSPELSVSSLTLDLHHQILIGCLNRLYVIGGSWKQCLPAVRRELQHVLGYCRIHFFVEEQAMERAGTPTATLDNHRKVHRTIVSKMSASWEAFEQSPALFPFDDTLRFLRLWLLKHVKDEDQESYAALMRGNRLVEDDIRRIRYADVAKKLNMKGRKGADTSLKGVRVLIVEEVMDLRVLFQRVLQEQGAQVSTAKSVLEANTTVTTMLPDMVLLGWSMDGAGVFAEDLYQHQGIPVIAATFGPLEAVVNACDLAGVAHILLHPASAIDVARIAQETMAGLVPLRALLADQQDPRYQAAYG